MSREYIMFKLIRLVALLAISAFSVNATAAVVIDFQTGPDGAGGIITESGGDVVGTNINISLLTVDGAGAMDGVYNADAKLNFDTAADTITIFGIVNGLGESLGSTPRNLLSGSFSSFSYDASGFNEVFIASGPDWKDRDLLRALEVDPTTPFDFFGFSVESVNGTVISTDIVNTAVPVPAAVWLFGSGLLGLVGVARRRA